MERWLACRSKLACRPSAESAPLESLVPADTANSSYLQIGADPLVQSSSTAAKWQAGLTLPVYALGVNSPAAGLNQYLPATRDARAPVLPSLFLPGFPKSATTWLFNCMLASFAPSQVGCGTLAANWTAAACGRRFLLTALRWPPVESVWAVATYAAVP